MAILPVLQGVPIRGVFLELIGASAGRRRQFRMSVLHLRFDPLIGVVSVGEAIGLGSGFVNF
jgi:hypothetical protein